MYFSGMGQPALSTSLKPCCLRAEHPWVTDLTSLSLRFLISWNGFDNSTDLVGMLCRINEMTGGKPHMVNVQKSVIRRKKKDKKLVVMCPISEHFRFISVSSAFTTQLDTWLGLIFCMSKLVSTFFLFCPQGLWDLSSLTSNWTQATAVKVLSPSHWTVREFPVSFDFHWTRVQWHRWGTGYYHFYFIGGETEAQRSEVTCSVSARW